jgi:glycosyltransferase involved in cell wall biosynthesis
LDYFYKMKLTHIVPRFWPQFDGLGDYARLLGDCLLAKHDIKSRYIVGDPAWPGNGSPILTQHEVCAVPAQAATDLLRVLRDSEIIVLHYVGYGYHARGVPFWINLAMRQWRESDSGRRLVVVFHELWASGPPWKSECYLGLLQRKLVSELHRMADLSITSGQLGMQRLNAIQRRRTLLHPVPSGISIAAAADRTWAKAGAPVTLALFGMPVQRELSLRKHLRLVNALERNGLLARVNVIGKGAKSGYTPSDEVRLLRKMIPWRKIHVVPDASPEEVGRVLSESDLMLSFYPSRWIAKSGSVMAALANGAVPVLREGKDLVLLKDGVEVLVCGNEKTSIANIIESVRQGELARIGAAGREWYLRTADWPILGARLAETLHSIVADKYLNAPQTKAKDATSPGFTGAQISNEN